MQEFLLFGAVPEESHDQVLQQLTGVSRMQPQSVMELHIIFKAKVPSGIFALQKLGSGGSQGVVLPEVQKTKTMLSSSLYHVQLVATRSSESSKTEHSESVGRVSNADSDVVMSDGNSHEFAVEQELSWALEFKDTPDPGRQPVTTRLMSRTPIIDGDPISWVQEFGFDYVARYFLVGHKFFDQDSTLFLHQVMQVPHVDTRTEAKMASSDLTTVPQMSKLVPLDGSGGYVLSVSIETAEGSNVEVRERATRQLLAMKEILRQAVNLAPGDRLALDTKVAFNASQHR